jgi:hypothetical protein
VWQTEALWEVNASNTAKTITGLSENTKYVFKVKAKNGSNVETDFSSKDSLYTLAKVPAAPTVNAASTTSLNVAINANGNPANTTYAIQETGGSKYVQSDGSLGDNAVWQTEAVWETNAGNTAKTVTGLNVNTQNTFKVKARNGNDVETAFSGTTSLYTLANVPSPPTVNNPTATTLDVTVNANGNPASTEFAIQDSVNGTFLQASGTMGATAVWQTATIWGTKTVTGLSTGVTYYFRVKARNADSIETAYGLTTAQNTCSNPTTGGSIAASQTICYSTAAAALTSTSLPDNYGGTLEYKWQYATTTDSTAFSDIASTDSVGHYPGILIVTKWFRRLARVNCKADWVGAAISNVVKLTVRPNFTAGTIASTGETICYNGNPTEIGSTTLASGGDENISYQWQSSLNAGFNSPTDINSNTASYTPDAGLTITTWYRRQAKDGSCNGFTSSTGLWKVTVRPNFTSGVIASAGETVYYDGNPVIINSTTDANGGNEIISYKWQKSLISSSSGFIDLPGAIVATYDQDTITVTTWYRRQAKDGLCNTNWNISTGVWKTTVVNAPSVLVRNTLNTGYGSLRTAIANVADAGTISFVDGLNGQTINLTSGTITIDKNLTLNNSNHTSGISISGSGDNITINTGKKLTLASNCKITVIGAIKNNTGISGLQIESGASFIQNNINLAATIKRELSNKWHLFGSPFKKNAGAVLTSITPVGGSVQMKPYTNGSNWLANVTSPNYYLLPTQGYAVKTNITYTVSLSGNLYYSPTSFDYTNTLVYTGTASTQSWNLMANPYTSYIDWRLLGKTNLNNSLYLWDNTLYPTISPVANAVYFRTFNAQTNVGVPAGTLPYIAPLQGFFVKAIYTTPKLSFPPSARVHNTATYYKDASTTDILVRLKTETEAGMDELVICQNPDAKLDYEGFDSEKMFSDLPLEIYSQSLTGEKLVINTINNTQHTIIPLGIKGTAGSKAKITTFGLETAEQIYLEDRFKGKLINLTENTSYEFEFPTDHITGRFFIRFGDINSALLSSDVKIFENDKILNIIAQTGENIEMVEVFTVTGARVFKSEPGNNMLSTKLNLTTGVYLVRIKTNFGIQNVKINWK